MSDSDAADLSSSSSSDHDVTLQYWDPHRSGKEPLSPRRRRRRRRFLPRASSSASMSSSYASSSASSSTAATSSSSRAFDAGSTFSSACSTAAGSESSATSLAASLFSISSSLLPKTLTKNLGWDKNEGFTSGSESGKQEQDLPGSSAASLSAVSSTRSSKTSWHQQRNLPSTLASGKLRPRSNSDGVLSSPSPPRKRQGSTVAPFRRHMTELHESALMVESSSSSDSDVPETPRRRRTIHAVGPGGAGRPAFRAPPSGLKFDRSNASLSRSPSVTPRKERDKIARSPSTAVTADALLRASLTTPSRPAAGPSWFASIPSEAGPQTPPPNPRHQSCSSVAPSPSRMVEILPTLQEGGTCTRRSSMTPQIRSPVMSPTKRRPSHIKRPSTSSSIVSNADSTTSRMTSSRELLAPPKSTSSVSLITVSCLDHVDFDRGRPRITMRFRDPWHPNQQGPPASASFGSMSSVQMGTMSDHHDNSFTSPAAYRHKRHATASDVHAFARGDRSSQDTPTFLTASSSFTSFSRLPTSSTFGPGTDSFMSRKSNDLPPCHGGRIQRSHSSSNQAHSRRCSSSSNSNAKARPAINRSQSAVSGWPALLGSSSNSIKSLSSNPSSIKPVAQPSTSTAEEDSLSLRLPPLSPKMAQSNERRSRMRPVNTRMRSAKRFQELQIDVGLANTPDARTMPPNARSTLASPASASSQHSFSLFASFSELDLTDVETPPLSASSGSFSTTEDSDLTSEDDAAPPALLPPLLKTREETRDAILSEAFHAASLDTLKGKNRRSSSFSKDSMRVKVSHATSHPHPYSTAPAFSRSTTNWASAHSGTARYLQGYDRRQEQGINADFAVSDTDEEVQHGVRDEYVSFAS